MLQALSLSEIAQVIKDNADQIDVFLQKNGVANSTFQLGEPEGLSYPAEVEAARQNLFDAMEQMTAAIRGPTEHIFQLTDAMPFAGHIALQAVEKFGIARAFAVDETISYEELATRCNLDRRDLTQMVKTAISYRVFEAAGPAHVKHNAASAVIATNPDLHDWIEVNREDVTPAGFQLVNALEKFAGSSEPNETGFTLAHGKPGTTMFDAMKDDQRHADRFAGAMRLIASSTKASIPRIVDALGFEETEGTIVDVGGSQGEICSAILRKAPRLRGVVQDRPIVVASARVPADLEGRLTFQASNFLEEQPEPGADIYFFRKILHDWSDVYCRRIIQNLVPAMKPGARVVLNELCLPATGQIHPRREQALRNSDITMRALFNGAERDEEEWKALFASVDHRFRFRGARAVPGAALSIIEFEWRE